MSGQRGRKPKGRLVAAFYMPKRGEWIASFVLFRSAPQGCLCLSERI